MDGKLHVNRALIRTRRETRPGQGAGTQTDAAATRPDLPLPHERDESPDPFTVDPQPGMRRAGADVAKGLVDTEERKQATDVFERSGGNGNRTGRRKSRHPHQRLRRR